MQAVYIRDLSVVLYEVEVLFLKFTLLNDQSCDLPAAKRSTIHRGQEGLYKKHFNADKCSGTLRPLMS